MADSTASRKSASAASRSKPAPKGEDSSRKLLVVLLLLLCCGGSGYFTWNTYQMLQNSEDTLQTLSMPQPPDPAGEAEKKEIASAEESLNNLSRSSTRAMQTALQTETQSRFPMDLPITLVATAPVTQGVEIIAEPEPPYLTVVAVMITDTDRAALVNVDGERGILVRQGSKFSEGKARITKIDAKGVTFVWMKKSFQVTL